MTVANTLADLLKPTVGGNLFFRGSHSQITPCPEITTDVATCSSGSFLFFLRWSLCSLNWPPTQQPGITVNFCSSSASNYKELGLKVCITTPRASYAWNRTRGFIHARQASYRPGLHPILRLVRDSLVYTRLALNLISVWGSLLALHSLASLNRCLVWLLYSFFSKKLFDNNMITGMRARVDFTESFKRQNWSERDSFN